MQHDTMRLALSILLCCCVAHAENYYVRTDGSDSNTGTANTAGGAWRNWSKATSTAVDGDVVRNGNAGTWEEIITETTSGITYIGNANGAAVVRGLKTSSASNHKWIGFTVTHEDNSYGSSPNAASGTYTNVWYIDCIVTNAYVGSSGYSIAFTGTRSYCGVRNCVISGSNTTVGGDHNCYGVAADGTNSHHIVVEYCRIEKVNDYIAGSFGQSNLFRNNWFGGHTDSDWSTGSGHSDFLQLGSDGAQWNSRHMVVERNFGGTNDCEGMAEAAKNGHFLLLNSSFQDTNFLVRGNIMFGINNGTSPGLIGTDKVSTYDQTLHDYDLDSFGQMQVFRSTASPSLDGMIANTLFSVVTGSTEANKAFVVESGCTATVARNWGYQVGTDSSFMGTTDPLFVSPVGGARDFHLQSSSPVRGQGTNAVWINSANGSGTSFQVNDAQLLFDGFGIVEGDVVKVGSTTTRVTAIDWGTSNVTVAASVTWTQGDPVYWGPLGSQKDIGALPYGSADLTAATYTKVGNVYTVTPTGDARGVWFYVDGIPTTWDYDAPYQQTIASGTVTMKAYALYAQEDPVVNATEESVVSGNPATAPKIRGIRLR